MKFSLASTTASIWELLRGRDDDLPINVCHYIQDLCLELGQDVMKVYLPLSLNYAPHEII